MNLVTRSFSALVIAAITVTAAVAVPGQQASALYRLGRCGSVEVVSHRGMDDATHSENTIRSFTNGLDKGAHTLETDIRLTKDNQWVLMHDATVDRTTVGSAGAVANLTLEQIKGLTTNDGVKGGVPSLAEYAAFVQSQPRVYKTQVELKTLDATTEQTQAALAILENAGIKSKTMMISFGGTALSKVDSSWKRGFISSSAVSVATVKKYGGNIILRKDAATYSTVTKYRNNGIRVYAWTVNTKTDWQRLVKNGVNGITTDEVNLMNRYCNNV